MLAAAPPSDYSCFACTEAVFGLSLAYRLVRLPPLPLVVLPHGVVPGLSFKHLQELDSGGVPRWRLVAFDDGKLHAVLTPCRVLHGSNAPLRIAALLRALSSGGRPSREQGLE